MAGDVPKQKCEPLQVTIGDQEETKDQGRQQRGCLLNVIELLKLRALQLKEKMHSPE